MRSLREARRFLGGRRGTLLRELRLLAWPEPKGQMGWTASLSGLLALDRLKDGGAMNRTSQASALFYWLAVTYHEAGRVLLKIVGWDR